MQHFPKQSGEQNSSLYIRANAAHDLLIPQGMPQPHSGDYNRVLSLKSNFTFRRNNCSSLEKKSLGTKNQRQGLLNY
jgi:hypothetical protein